MAIELARIQGVSVFQDDDGRVHWMSGATIDADGANGQNGNPFAYRMDNHGLDALASAGWPDGSWRNVLIDRGDGHPLEDDRGNVFSKTTYAWKGRAIPDRFVDATAVPYAVVNPIVRKNAVGVVIGCRARLSFNGKSIDAVVADVGGAARIGELSIAAAKQLGIPSSSRTGGVDNGVLFEFWSGSAAVIGGEIYELQRAISD